MLKKIRPVSLVIISSLVWLSCMKKSGPKEIQESLKTTMELYLNHQPRIDTSKVKFKVTEVTYYEEKTAYLCEFKVNMQDKSMGQLKDTTGSMSASISKDFKDVTRKN